MNDYAAGWYKWIPLIEEAAGDLSLRMLERAGVAPGHRVLDLATGNGEPALAAARCTGPEGYVLGVDISEAMIDYARERAKKSGLANAEFRVMDIESLSVSESFDIVLCRWGLMFVDDLPGTLGRVRSALKPGGRLSVAVWAFADETPTLSLAERTAHGLLGLPAPDEGANTPFALSDTAKLVATFENAGFGDIELQRVPVAFEFTSINSFIDYRLDVSSRFMDATAGLEEKDREAVLRAVAHAAEPYQGSDGTVRMENFAFCLSASRP